MKHHPILMYTLSSIYKGKCKLVEFNIRDHVEKKYHIYLITSRKIVLQKSPQICKYSQTCLCGHLY